MSKKIMCARCGVDLEENEVFFVMTDLPMCEECAMEVDLETVEKEDEDPYYMETF